MAAPTRRASAVITSPTTNTAQPGTVAAGDLVIVGVSVPSIDAGLVPTVTLYDGLTPIVTLSTPVIEHNPSGSTKRAMLFAHVLTATPSSTFGITINNWPTSGTTRRWGYWILTPASGNQWSSATPVRTASTASLTTTNYTAPAWGAVWSATYSGAALGGACIAVTNGGTTSLSLDFDTGAAPPDGTYEATNNDGAWGWTQQSNGAQGFGEAFSSNPVGDNPNIGVSANRTGATASPQTLTLAGAYWVTIATPNPIAMAGTGTLTVAGHRIKYGAAALSGTGTLTVAGYPSSKRGAAALAGTGTLTTVGHVVRRAPGRSRTIGAAIAAKYGAGYARRSPGRGRTVTWAGAQGRHGLHGGAVLAGSGTLTTGGHRTRTGRATLTGFGDLTAGGHLPGRGTALIGGTGALTASGTGIRHGAGVLPGTGDLNATGSLTLVWYGTATLAGAGTLSAAGDKDLYAQGTAHEGTHTTTAHDGAHASRLTEAFR